MVFSNDYDSQVLKVMYLDQTDCSQLSNQSQNSGMQENLLDQKKKCLSILSEVVSLAKDIDNDLGQFPASILKREEEEIMAKILPDRQIEGEAENLSNLLLAMLEEKNQKINRLEKIMQKRMQMMQSSNNASREKLLKLIGKINDVFNFTSNYMKQIQITNEEIQIQYQNQETRFFEVLKRLNRQDEKKTQDIKELKEKLRRAEDEVQELRSQKVNPYAQRRGPIMPSSLGQKPSGQKEEEEEEEEEKKEKRKKH